MFALAFPGQGSQHKGMGAQLFGRFPEEVARADEILGYSIEELCRDDVEGRLQNTEYTQPALFVVNALSHLAHRADGGAEPDYLAGHSLGEYNALHAAGAFDFATGLRLVAKRGELMSRVADGGMAAVVGLTAEQVAELLARPGLENLSIANYNNPTQIVVAGPRDDVAGARAVFEEAGAGLFTVLRVSGAFHSPYMSAIQGEFAEFLSGFTLAPPAVPVISNVTALPYEDDVAAALVRQLDHPVRWTDTVRYLIAQGVADIKPIGPGRAMRGLIKATRRDEERRAEEAREEAAAAEEAARTAAAPASGGELRLRRPERDRARPEGTPAVQLHQALLKDLRTTVAQVLKVEPAVVRSETELSELGFDSIRLIEFADLLRRDLGVDLTPSVFFEHFTLEAFARHLLTEHHDLVSARYPDAGDDAPRTGPRGAGRAQDDAPLPDPYPVAVVGLSAVLPGSADLEGFWQRLLAGDELVTEVPEDRWRDWAGAERAARAHGAFLDEVDSFDCSFFGISPHEAELMDPHQRLFLQTVWKAVEDSGRRPDTLAGSRTGLFVGLSSMDYAEVLGHSAAGPQAHTATGLSHAVLPNRVSYQLDLRGPSEAIDTACSSSLVAVHRAVRSLRTGECGLAIAGGVNLMLSPTPFECFELAGMLAPDGRCKTFDQSADGYVRGEGVVAVVLKPLAAAEADGDHIHAVIRGSAVGHSGRAASLTAPSPEAQADVIVDAWRAAGLDPATATHVETHGTGTSLGDPIEIEGLKQAFARLYAAWGHDAPAEPHITLGSVKTAIGHLEAAAGLAGLVTMVQALRYGKLPALRHFEKLNPYIRLDGSPFRIGDRAGDWPRRTAPEGPVPRRCGVSSFGFGGSNAHVVLEEYEREPAGGEAPSAPLLIPLSARTPDALRDYARELVRHLDLHAPAGGTADFALTALADTLQLGREPMAARLAVVAEDADELYDALVHFLRGEDQGDTWWSGQATGAADLSRALLAGPEGNTYLDALAAAGKTAALARLWAAGADFDWALLRGGRPVRRTPLPTYPFERRPIRPQDLVPHVLLTPGQAQPALAAAPAPAALAAAPAPAALPSGAGAAQEAVLGHLVGLFAEELKWRPEEIDPRAGFDDLGLSSLLVEKLRRRLEEHYGPVDSATLFTYKNLDALARHMAGRVRTPPAATPAPADVQSAAVRPAAVQPGALRPAPVPPAAAGAGTADIAIVGISGRYPKAPTVADFWDRLLAGDDCVDEIPLDRPGYRRYAELAREKFGDQWPRWGGFLDDVDAFDPQFFHISPRDARLLDPQERLFLTTAWETLEDAGYTPASLADPELGDERGSVGVFAGVTYNNYQMFAGGDLDEGVWRIVGSQTFSVANRISHLLNLGGPSLTLDTACSSSLYALHLAVAAIRRGECAMALAGGVNLSLHPSKYVMLAEAGFLAEDGRCRAFAEGGTGYVPAEAVGAVLLKPLDRALADGDRIHAVIKGSAVNSDGRTYGYGVPNPVAQAELVRAALADAGVDAGSIGYVEAHGTGTSLGDPIEVRGLTEAYADAAVPHRRDGRPACAIGSVKATMGHAEAAAGIAQVTKVVLQLRHGTLVPSLLHTPDLNPNLDLDSTPFAVQRETAPWEPPVLSGPGGPVTGPRRAGVSSFGAGGVNVHLILEEAPARPAPAAAGAGRPLVFPLSARTPENLRAYAARMAAFLRALPAEPGAGDPEVPRAADVAYTLQHGREPMEYRAAFAARTLAEAAERFARVAAGDDGDERISTGRRPGRSGAAPAVPADAAPEQAAALWAAGGDADWAARPTGGRRVSLPTYPFSQERYWLEPSATNPARPTAPAVPIPVPAPRTAPEAEDSAAAPAAREAAAAADLLASLAAAPASERHTALATRMQQTLGELLEFPPGSPPDRQRGFFELGMDSVMAVRLGNLLEEALGLVLYAGVVFDYPSIDELAAYLLDELSLDDAPAPAAPEPAAEAPESAPDGALQVVHYTAGWEPAAAPEGPASWLTGPVLVFDDDGALTERVRDRHSGAAPVVGVRPGEAYEVAGDGRTVRAGSAQDHAALLAGLDAPPVTVLHAWSDPRTALTSVFHLSQALLRQGLRAPVRLLRVTAHTDGAPDPLAEAFGGFARSVDHENPRLVQQAVAVRADAGEETAAALLRACEAELAADARADAEVRHDADGRRVRRLRELPAVAPDAPGGVAVRPGGTYVITGGGGGLGLLFAEHLARQARVNLLLVGRSPLTGERQEALERIRALGADVRYERADVSDRGDVEWILAAARNRWGSVHGVIHSAGVLRDGLLPNKTADEIDLVLAGKVDGAVHFDAETAADDLDFFMVFSSLAALAGNPGQVDYAFASRFLNAFSRRREELRAAGERSGASIALVWPFWREGGMRVDESTEGFVRRRLGLTPLENAVGVEAFDAALRHAAPEFGVVHAERDKLQRVLRIEPPAAESAARRPAAAAKAGGGKPAAAKGDSTVEIELKGVLAELGL
ncbi:[acyl-carrier-protein] S-malonyltransferase [Streptomyces sp. WAC 06738]|uniref:type I polyketide synthase n=1 Tax=Streptomyces sp. WAC 06738 TaxID=2203210 RepID=UPI000F6CA6A9|nr:type I polyketide synthase [Streptomyces sp. WAC 06738]AZM44515.1 [acyl-carrier-protein] S-malonyltransferase [Streptomyces sp. WAC 06738]